MTDISIALFGSAARQSYDKYSDKDLLLVGENYELLNDERLKYEKMNYSVSSYTYKKLEYLSSVNSLFVEHLKREAQIISDASGRLDKLLGDHVYSLPSQSDLLTAKGFFRPFNVIPSSAVGLAWYLDCFYVGLRNLLIVKSAMRNTLNFSYLGLISELVAEDSITEAESRVLTDIRISKRAYRENTGTVSINQSRVEVLTGVALRFGLISSGNLVNDGVAARHYYEVFSSRIYSPYQRLRAFEFVYRSKGIRIERIERYIKNPQMYTSKLLNDSFVEELDGVLLFEMEFAKG